MNDLIDISTVDWSRAQFALTAMYHYLFVPLTLGLSLIIATMETLWVKTNKEEWKIATKFWMKLFGINFAIGVATGLILEFEFGTNWSSYSWFVGDIFGAPLAIEGIMAFFMESTFIAIMFFGWNKVSKKQHLLSSWLVFLGANLSALWILVANAWMQDPVGMQFNPDTVRNEMLDFWAVLLSPTAINKFSHTVLSAYLLSSSFTISISSWFLLKKKHANIAKKSIVIASFVGLISSLLTIYSGDTSSRNVADTQIMKFAAMEGIYEGDTNKSLTIAGILSKNEKGFYENKYKIQIPGMLSYLTYYDFNSFIPGVKNIIEGYTDFNGTIHPSLEEKIKIGKKAMISFKNYAQFKKEGKKTEQENALINLRNNYKYFGYGNIKKTKEIVPYVPLIFYSFHIMVGVGFLFLIIFILSLYIIYKKKIEKHRWLLWINFLSLPLAYVAIQCGWIVAEVGRQPWVIQDLMTTKMAVSNINSTSVILTFWIFAILFTSLLVAEISIMITQIKKGPSKE